MLVPPNVPPLSTGQAAPKRTRANKRNKACRNALPPYIANQAATDDAAIIPAATEEVTTLVAEELPVTPEPTNEGLLLLCAAAEELPLTPTPPNATLLLLCAAAEELSALPTPTKDAITIPNEAKDTIEDLVVLAKEAPITEAIIEPALLVVEEIHLPEPEEPIDAPAHPAAPEDTAKEEQPIVKAVDEPDLNIGVETVVLNAVDQLNIAAPEEVVPDAEPKEAPAPTAAHTRRSLLADIVGAVLRLAAPVVAVATVAFKRLRALLF